MEYAGNSEFMTLIDSPAIFANPPFGKVDTSAISLHGIGDFTQIQSYFLHVLLKGMEGKGKALIILPENSLRTQTKDRMLRQQMIDERCIQSIIKLPLDIFKPFSRVNTSIVVIDYSQQHDTILFSEIGAVSQLAELSHIGSLDSTAITYGAITDNRFIFDPLDYLLKEAQEKVFNSEKAKRDIKLLNHELDVINHEIATLTEEMEGYYDD